MKLPSAQGRLENVRRVNGSLCGTGAHNGVHFIHKEDHVAAAADLRQHIPKPFLKFAPVFGSRHQIGHIQTDEAFVLQLRRHIPGRHALSQPLSNGRLTNARFTYESGIILALAA